MRRNKTVVFIGAGNVATHLSQAMKGVGFSVRQVFSRTADSAKALADILDCSYTTDIKMVLPDADIYVFSLKDDALPNIVADMAINDGLWIHTAGSVHVDVFCGYAKRYGVLYPMQTLSKSRETDFSIVPLFVEGCTEDVEDDIFKIAGMLSENIMSMGSDKRRYVHLAAVFACNFSNHMYSLAAKILDKEGIDSNILLPLIDETASKMHSMSPQEAQTGPAVRYDRNVIDRHLSMLEEESMRRLYTMMSESIHEEVKIKN